MSLTLMFAATGSAADPQTKLVLFWGQSNCTGEDDYTNITNANGYVNKYTPVVFTEHITEGISDPIPFNGSYGTGSLAPRQPAGQVNFGPELAMGRRLNLVQPGAWCISKWGLASSGLSANWLPTQTFPTLPAGSPNLFTQAMNDAATQAIAQNATVSALVWVQGETDALTSGTAVAYEANLSAFVSTVRATYANLPIVIARIPAASPVASGSNIRAAQQNVVAASGNMILVDTDDLTPLITTYHFNANNLVTLGNRLASGVLAAIGMPNITASVPWTVDGDRIGFPLNWTEAQAVMTASYIYTGGPFHITDFSVSNSGYLPDLIGNVPLTASGAPVGFQVFVPGFTRTGVSGTEASTSRVFSSSSLLPDIGKESMMTMAYVRIDHNPGTFRNVVSIGKIAGPRVKISMKQGGVIDYFEGNTSNTSGTQQPAGAVRPFIAQRNVTTQTASFYSDQETFTIPWDSTVTGSGLELVGGVNGAISGTTMYEMSFRGAAAEMSASQVKMLLSTLGWNVQWNTFSLSISPSPAVLYLT